MLIHTNYLPVKGLTSLSIENALKITCTFFYGAQVFSLPVKSRTKDPRPGIAQLITYTFISSLLLYNSAVLATTTTTAQYTYNADGALTQITTQVDQQASIVNYLVWDNYLPNTADASSGIISPANGNLLGYGSSTDIAQLSYQFEYDILNRLSHYSDQANSVTYSYHSTWLMATSTLDSGDALRFYYNARSNPQMVSIEHQSSGEIASHFGPLALLSDGSSQILLSPRKDVSGVYQPELESLTSYKQDTYGSNEQNNEPSAYDLQDNAFQYAGEYKDPSWGGYYQRARWYHPGLQIFLSRDSHKTLNRYGYTAGNPVNRIDPSGNKYKSYKKFMRPLAKFVQDSNFAPGGVPVSRIVFGSVLTPLALIANPAGFYHQQIGPDHGLRLWVAIGTVALGVATDGALAEETDLITEGVRLTSNVVSGVANAEAGATSHNFHQFNKQVFFSGLEYTAGSIVQAKLLSTVGALPVSKLQDKLLPWDGFPTSSQFATVFRVQIAQSTVDPFSFQENRKPLVKYHQSMVDFGEHRQQVTHFFNNNIRPENPGNNANFQSSELNKPDTALLSNKTRIHGKSRYFHNVSPNTRIQQRFTQIMGASIETPSPYDLIHRNSQIHAASMLHNINLIGR